MAAVLLIFERQPERQDAVAKLVARPARKSLQTRGIDAHRSPFPVRV
jgi:hypothetical protein